MSSGQTVTTQLQLSDVSLRHDLTVFSPPGIFIESGKYPRLRAGILATPQPSEFTSIYDHPEAWMGLNRDAIVSMRRNLYFFSLPVDARTMRPRYAVDILRTIALSVSPVALSVEATTLPPRDLIMRFGSLPSSPEVHADSFEIISKPEVSKVAEKISGKDIPACEGILRLLDYDYSLEQVTRLLSVGLLGRHQNRRLLPTSNASRVVADTVSSHVQNMFADIEPRDQYRIHISRPLGELMVVVSCPGKPALDYFRVERYQGRTRRGFSSSDEEIGASDARTASYANSAKLSAMQHMWKKKSGMKITVFHLSNNVRNQILNGWIPRAGVSAALESDYTELNSYDEMLNVLDAVLDPPLSVWIEDLQQMKKMTAPSVLSYT
ncbi:hypothetical protein EU537_10960 [Candidatus Thorarchaeota archaeon]|nr:MAG: hypothetical protein EU537_10960 [Candidatus Thorarchaeota archaeon]